MAAKVVKLHLEGRDDPLVVNYFEGVCSVADSEAAVRSSLRLRSDTALTYLRYNPNEPGVDGAVVPAAAVWTTRVELNEFKLRAEAQLAGAGGQAPARGGDSVRVGHAAYNRGPDTEDAVGANADKQLTRDETRVLHDAAAAHLAFEDSGVYVGKPPFKKWDEQAKSAQEAAVQAALTSCAPLGTRDYTSVETKRLVRSAMTRYVTSQNRNSQGRRTVSTSGQALEGTDSHRRAQPSVAGGGAAAGGGGAGGADGDDGDAATPPAARPRGGPGNRSPATRAGRAGRASTEPPPPADDGVDPPAGAGGSNRSARVPAATKAAAAAAAAKATRLFGAFKPPAVVKVTSVAKTPVDGGGKRKAGGAAAAGGGRAAPARVAEDTDDDDGHADEGIHPGRPSKRKRAPAPARAAALAP